MAGRLSANARVSASTFLAPISEARSAGFLRCASSRQRKQCAGLRGNAFTHCSAMLAPYSTRMLSYRVRMRRALASAHWPGRGSNGVS